MLQQETDNYKCYFNTYNSNIKQIKINSSSSFNCFFSEKVLIDIEYHLTVGTLNYLSMSNVNYITG